MALLVISKFHTAKNMPINVKFDIKTDDVAFTGMF